MLQNITLNQKEYKTVDNPGVRLNNGCLIVHYMNGQPAGVYLVTSFRDQKGSLRTKGLCTTSYCTLINLDTGKIAFEEQCSRNTTMGRILAHLNRTYDQGSGPLSEGQRLEVYPNGKYTCDIKYDTNDSLIKGGNV